MGILREILCLLAYSRCLSRARTAKEEMVVSAMQIILIVLGVVLILLGVGVLR